MDYNYETLLEQRFQMLCQSLLIKEYPGLQCMPIAMPDGGIDALQVFPGREPIIFQVKYARNPTKIDDIFKWLTKAVDGEMPKIQKLAERGSFQYILMTNISGTSHLDVGTIAKVQAYLDENLPVSARCFWRDELDRRLDVNYDLKLRYPSLLSGADAMRLMYEKACAGEGYERRRRALTSYIGHQYNQDRMVRFKQADLPASSLFRLFVDVPVKVPETQDERSAEIRYNYGQAAIRHISSRTQSDNDGESAGELKYHIQQLSKSEFRILVYENGHYRAAQLGAAALLFDPEFVSATSPIVIEGAPGQGKSTFAQFLAQVHRYRLLNRPPAERPPDDALLAPLNLPFKIELQDVAQWLEGFDPWEPEHKVPHNKPRTLESAISGHVERFSGGVSFNAADFLLTLESVPVLIILDALDEVADIAQRTRVIDEVQDCIGRLSQQACEVRFVITSRPTAIADSPSFSDETCTYLTLAPLPTELAVEYADRWSSVRRLNTHDKNEVRRILRLKMSAPHMAELAKNTMQLSILLNLIHARGESLPDKRTELYDTYIDVFFTREAEKSDTVKKHRALLIDIHRYLGYYLHARAEGNRSTGRISYAELKRVVSEYLISEGRSTQTIDELLFGMVQRVVALVSRIEGTYEFEVQPLREYFAARHLYDTASYSPAGRNRTGTKPDRFDGIARNPYWLNVTRFFCGCFSKGELLDLAERVAQLSATPDLNLLTYPRMLGAALLQDWVFTQSPRATRQVIEAIFDGYGLRWAGIMSEPRAFTRLTVDTSLKLSEETGAEPLVIAAWPHVLSASGEGLAQLCRYLRSLSVDEKVGELWWHEVGHRSGDSKLSWLWTGAMLGVFESASIEQIEPLLKSADDPDATDEDALAALVLGGVELRQLPETCHMIATQLLLDRLRSSEERIGSTRATGALSVLRSITVPELWTQIGRGFHPRSIFQSVASEKRFTNLDNEVATKVGELIELVRLSMDRPQFDFYRDANIAITKSFGASCFGIELGVISGNAYRTAGSYIRADQLFDSNSSLADRIRSARRRSGNVNWWTQQLLNAETVYDRLLWALSLYTWATVECFGALLPIYSSTVASLPENIRKYLLEACRRSRYYSRPSTRTLDSVRTADLVELDPSSIATILPRVEKSVRDTVARGLLFSNLEAPGVADSVMSYIAYGISSGKMRNEEALALARACYIAGVTQINSYLYRPDQRATRISTSFGTSILRDCWNLPNELVTLAIRAVGNRLPPAIPVESIAESERWFASD